MAPFWLVKGMKLTSPSLQIQYTRIASRVGRGKGGVAERGFGHCEFWSQWNCSFTEAKSFGLNELWLLQNWSFTETISYRGQIIWFE